MPRQSQLCKQSLPKSKDSKIGQGKLSVIRSITILNIDIYV